MRHASDGLVEKSPGTFSRRSKAFLHFHVDPAGLFADLKEGDDFERYRVATKAEQRRLLTKVRALTPRAGFGVTEAPPRCLSNAKTEGGGGQGVGVAFFCLTQAMEPARKAPTSGNLPPTMSANQPGT